MAKKNNTKNEKAGTENRGVQTFSITAPAATNVQLAGDFTSWQQQPIKMTKDADGTWRTAVRLSPGPHPYRFLVDGQWQDDPKCLLHVPNPFGGQDAVRMVT